MTMGMKAATEYKTSDLALAAAIISNGISLLRTESIDVQKVAFVFYDHGQLTELVDAFWSDQLKINARTMFENIKMLKSRIYAGRL